MINDWKTKLVNLKCVNYNMYFGVDGGDNAIPFDDARDELIDFVDQQIASTAQQCVKILEKMRRNEHEEYINDDMDGNYNDALDEAILAIKKQFGIKE